MSFISPTFSPTDDARKRAPSRIGARAPGGTFLLAAGLFASLACLPSCRHDERRPVDERLLLALEEARALQHRADTHLEGGDVPAAISDVSEVLAIAFPPDAPEGEESRLDAWARLARLHLAGGGEAAETAALSDVERGRHDAHADSFYRAHLETVGGEIFEARAKRIAAADPAGGRAARRDALAAYSRSIEINRHVQAMLVGTAP